MLLNLEFAYLRSKWMNTMSCASMPEKASSSLPRLDCHDNSILPQEYLGSIKEGWANENMCIFMIQLKFGRRGILDDIINKM